MEALLVVVHTKQSPHTFLNTIHRISSKQKHASMMIDKAQWLTYLMVGYPLALSQASCQVAGSSGVVAFAEVVALLSLKPRQFKKCKRFVPQLVFKTYIII